MWLGRKEVCVGGGEGGGIRPCGGEGEGGGERERGGGGREDMAVRVEFTSCLLTC